MYLPPALTQLKSVRADVQIAEMNRLYWTSTPDLSASAMVTDVAEVLSKQEFLAAVAGFAAEENGADYPSDTDGAGIQETIRAELDKRIKDKSVVEVELATKVADRLVSWSKTFGFFVAAPLVVLLLILNLFGWSKFEDVRRVADSADELLKQAKSQQQSTEAQMSSLKDRSKNIDKQSADLQEISSRNASRLGSLDQAVQQIETRLGTVNRSEAYPNRTFRQKIDEGQFDALYIYIFFLGPWALSEDLAKRLVTQPDFPWRDAFKDLDPNSEKFEAVWKALAPNEKERFLETQRSFIKLALYEPAQKEILARFQLDVSRGSEGLQGALFMAVAHPYLTGDPFGP